MAHQLYPDLVKQGVIPANADTTAEQLAIDFARRFTNGEMTAFDHVLNERRYDAVAATYLRYSDSNSQPTSLDDQLAGAMRKAASEKRFIPWKYCFADASVTGRTHLRRGYRLAKEALEQFKHTQLDTLYFDEFSRATRVAIGTYRLARLMEMLGFRLIGVRDGFVLGTQQAQILIMATAMFNEMFIAQLREKVLRGMLGAAERGTSLGAVRFGYELVDKIDDNSNSIINAKDKPVRIPAIHRENSRHVLQAARWVADYHLSYKEIARGFNAAKIDGSTAWQGSKISKMLACPIYIGTRIFNRPRTVWDKETGEFTVKLNPESEWIVSDMPELRIMDDDLWTRLRVRAGEVAAKAPRTGKKLDRTVSRCRTAQSTTST